MKPYEVGIIVAAIFLIGYFWYQNTPGLGAENPVNANSPGFRRDPSIGGTKGNPYLCC